MPASATSHAIDRFASAPRAWTHPLVWIVLVGALVRAGLWYGWSDWSPLFNDDARDYQRLATRLATTGTYSDARGNPISLRPPLYPAMVAGIYRLVGVENNDAVRATQAAISLLTVVLVYRLAVLAYAQRVAVWAAALVCFYPTLLGYTNVLLSETLFVLLVVAFSWLVCEAVHRQQTAMLASAGVAMALGALTRSILLLFSPVLALAVLLSWRGSWPRRITAAALPLVVFAAVIAPWAVRNTRVQETVTLIDVMGGRNAMMGNYEYTPLERSWATISDVPHEQQWYSVLHREYPTDRRRTQGQLDKVAMRHAIHFVWTHPWLTLKRDVVKFFNFWQLEREFIAAAQANYFGTVGTPAQLGLAAVICGCYAGVLALGVFGICCRPPADPRIHWFLLASIVFPCAVHSLIFAHSRYHLPVIPLLSIYAAAAIVHGSEIWRRRRTWSFALAAVLCLVVALSWTRELLAADLDTIKQLVSG